MNITRLDRIKNLYFTARINWRHPVNKAEHALQRARVLARETLSDNATERHATYPVRRTTGGWTNGPTIRPTITRTGGWRNSQAVPPRPVQPETRP